MTDFSALYPLFAALAAYLVGSLSFAVIVSRLMGLADPRSYGSGNPGATNVLRSGRKSAAIVTLLLDAAKGWLPVALVRWYGARWGLGEGTLALVALAAFVGHLYPVFFRFQGGKGVATALGVLLGVSGWLALVALAVFAAVLALTRYVSAASVAAALLAPAAYILGDGTLWMMAPPVLLALAVMSGLLLWRHRANLDRLFRGTESKLGAKAAASGAPAPAVHAHHGPLAGRHVSHPDAAPAAPRSRHGRKRKAKGGKRGGAR